MNFLRNVIETLAQFFAVVFIAGGLLMLAICCLIVWRFVF